jgi:hypothetical protein
MICAYVPHSSMFPSADSVTTHHKHKFCGRHPAAALPVTIAAGTSAKLPATMAVARVSQCQISCQASRGKYPAQTSAPQQHRLQARPGCAAAGAPAPYEKVSSSPRSM